MPSKKEEPPTPVVDTGVFGAFVTVAVGRVKLNAVPTAADGKLEKIKVHLVLSYPGDFAPLSGEPAEAPYSDGITALPCAFSKPFRQEASREGLLKLINGSVQLSLHDSGSGAQLATAVIDMLALALGSSFSLQDVQLVPCSSIGSSPIKVVSGVIPLVQVNLQARLAPEGHEAAAAAADPLPEMEDWAFLTAEEAAGANVVELALSGLDPLPNALKTAYGAAKEGKVPGSLTWSLALSLPGGAKPVILAGLGLHAEGQPAGARRRELLMAAECKELLGHLEDERPLTLEIARYLAHDALQDTNWEKYHGSATLQGCAASLTVMGATGHEEQVALATFPAGTASVLPEYTPNNAKGKPLDDGRPSTPLTPDKGSTAWEQSGTSLTVSIKLFNPLVPKWRPPHPPAAPLTALLNTRPAPIERYVAPSSALNAFKQLVSNLAGSIKQMALNGTTSNAGSEAKVPGSRALTAELHSTGQYKAMKEALTGAAVKVLLERFCKAHDAGVGSKEDGPSPEDIRRLHEELHSVLSSQLEEASGAGEGGGGEEGSGADEADRLLQLAGECEAGRMLRRAEALHQRRVLTCAALPSGALAWRDYGAFCMRVGQHGRGEECFREALQLLDSSQYDGLVDARVACLTALSAALLYQAKVTDPLHLAEARSALDEALHLSPDHPECLHTASVLWVLVAATRGGEEEAAEKVPEGFSVSPLGELINIERARSQADPDGPLSERNLPLRAAPALMELGLPLLALEALARAAAMPLTGAALSEVEIPLARAEALGRMGDAESEAEALMLLRALSSREGQTGAAADELTGHIHFQAGRYSDTVHAYQASLSKLPTSHSAPSKLFLQLAQSYMALRHPDWALNVYTMACSATPSASCWLGVSACCLAMQENEAASQALNEAALLDPENPSVWGRIALVALRSGRSEEAGPALKCAVRLGLEEPELLAALGKEYAGAEGGARAAENLLRAAVAKRPEDEESRGVLDALIAQRASGNGELESDHQRAL